jgi:hypothetical protein
LLCYHNPHWQKIHLYFSVYKLTWNHEDPQYYPQMVSVVLRIVNTCVLNFCVASAIWSL